jgi:hypothetical protein
MTGREFMVAGVLLLADAGVLGFVLDGSTNEMVMHVHLVDRPEPKPHQPWWVELIFSFYWLVVAILCGIGIVTVVRWIIASVGG